ncbi:MULTISPECIES: VPLPA-CTERM sorting domain-containing protein [unclassified Methylophaga]|uniref:VPLPA-CTERM sorting domain-containing protein n=1 Tax=unclassified Methylophaga TaxID=2629249 RepID=UPI00259C857E|nr:MULTISPECIES: VPLPA-CTERM sorting domain-containing protein [unclassified Methylophaga]
MKSLAVFSILILFSFNTFAEDDFTGLTGSKGFHDTYGTNKPDTFLTGGAINPYYYDLGEDLNYMYTSNRIASNINFNQTVLIEWQTFDVYDASFSLNILGDSIDTIRKEIDDTGYGYFLYNFDLVPEDEFVIGIFGKAINAFSQIEYRVSYYDGQDPSGQLFMPQTVPLPNSMWLLLPALIGFVGFRHRHS